MSDVAGAGSTAAPPALLSQHPARCSAAERRRRRDALLAIADAHDLDHLIVYGAHRAGTAVGWLTGWPTTREAAVVVRRDAPDTLFVQFRNHVPQARAVAHPDIDVRWGGAATIDSVVAHIAGGRRARPRVGVIGPLTHGAARHQAATAATIVPLDAAYTQLRLVKSVEEMAWMRTGAWLSDRGLDALHAGLRPDITERHVVDLAERAYVPLGGTTHICYVASTAMDDPHRSVPGQVPSPRRLRPGDVVVVELSAAFLGYAGQVLRTFTIDAPPTPLYRELHDVAEAARDAMLSVIRAGVTPAQIREAAGVIEDAGHTTCDDLLHGFGGGYLPPVVASRSHPDAPVPETTLAAGMTVVVQPNVVTLDGRAGVQTGELVAVTDDGYQRLHDVPDGLLRAGSSTAADAR